MLGFSKMRKDEEVNDQRRNGRKCRSWWTSFVVWCDLLLWMASNVAGDGEEGVLDWTRFG